MSDFVFGSVDAKGLLVGLKLLGATGDDLAYEFAIKNSTAAAVEVVLFRDTEQIYRTRLVAVDGSGKRTMHGAVAPDTPTIMGQTIKVSIASGETYVRKGRSAKRSLFAGAVKVFLELGESKSGDIAL